MFEEKSIVILDSLDHLTGDRILNDDILTMEEAAAFLKVDTAVVSALLASGELPGRQIGEHWRTTKRALICHVEGVSLQVVCCTPEEAASGQCCTPQGGTCC